MDFMLLKKAFNFNFQFLLSKPSRLVRISGVGAA